MFNNVIKGKGMKRVLVICSMLLVTWAQAAETSYTGLDITVQNLSKHDFLKTNLWRVFQRGIVVSLDREEDGIQYGSVHFTTQDSCWAELDLGVDIPQSVRVSLLATMKVQSPVINTAAASLFQEDGWVDFKQALLPLKSDAEFKKRNLEFLYGLKPYKFKKKEDMYYGTFFLNYDGAHTVEIMAVGGWYKPEKTSPHMTKKVTLTFDKNLMTGDFKKFGDESDAFEKALCQAARNRIVGK